MHSERGLALWPYRGRRPAVLVVAALLACVGGIARAQDAPATATAHDMLTVGERVRVSLSPSGRRQVTGTVDSVLAAAYVLDTVAGRRSLFFLDPGPAVLNQYRRTTVRFADIERLEVSQGINRWNGVLRYGLIGAGIGALIGGAGASSQINPTASQFGSGAVRGGLIGVVLGGGVGYYLGREQWAPMHVPLPPRRPTSPR